MNYRVFFACIALLYSSAAMAQNCGFNKQIEHNAPANNFFKKFEEGINPITTVARSKKDGIISIPVAVHILHTGQAIGDGVNITDGQVENAINSLNEAFAGTYGGVNAKIEFALAKYQDDCSQFKGINRVDASNACDKGDCYLYDGITFKNETKVKMLSAYSSHQYLNIWVVEKINGNNGGGVQGFTTFPGQSGFEDGVVILYNAFGMQTDNNDFPLKPFTNLNRTLIHEVGHALGLYHTFEGDDMNNDGFSDRCPAFNGCGVGKGDCIEDTPPHERTRFHCRTEEFNVCSGLNSIEEVIHNFMNYSDQGCMYEFTQGQVDRMHAVVEAKRPGWMDSNLHQPADMASGAYCLPQTTSLDNPFGLGIAKVQLNDQRFYSQNATVDGGYSNNQCFVFQVPKNAADKINVSIDNASNNMERVQVYIDIDGNSSFDADERFFESAFASKHSGVMSLAKVETGVYAMRVISVFAGFEIEGPCHTPAYSQVEDYSIQIVGAGASSTRHAFEANKKSFRLLQNPISDGILRIENNDTALQHIALFDFSGKQLQVFEVNDHNIGRFEYPMSDIPAGVYMIKAQYINYGESQLLTILD